MSWVNLHSHSEGSLLDGAGTPLQRANKAAKLEQDSCSLTDHGNLILIPNHIEACNDVGVKPIVGMEAYFKPDRFKQDKENRTAYHLTLIAKNYNGWQNLIKISTEAYLTGFYYKPCVDFDLLERYGQDIFIGSGCVGGYLPQLLQKEDTEKEIHETIERFISIGGDNYFFEIMPHDLPIQVVTNSRLDGLALEYDRKLVATGDSHYPDAEWRDTQDVILMIATGQSEKQRQKKKDEGEDIYSIKDTPLHMFSESELAQMFATNHKYLTGHTVRQSMENAQWIADQCEPIEINKTLKMPRPEVNADEQITQWCWEGMERIDMLGEEEYVDRLEHELETMRELGVMNYMYIVADIVREARRRKIRISSGRGSASGSLVCYLARITTIDPIAHELLFERFMNKNRKGLPDIDIDFEDRRRDEVIQYAKDKYGEDRVANIITLGTYGPKSALKDVARVLDVPFGEINAVSKVIPEPKDVGGAGNVPPLEVCRQMFSDIDTFAKKYPRVWKHATRIETHIKNVGTHAAGVVITDEPITTHMPLMRSKSAIVTAWSDTAKFSVISDYGWLKIDFLSLTGLSKQGQTVELIKEYHDIDIDLDELPVARDPLAVEPEVMEIFKKGMTLGVFQFGGSKGIISFLKQVKPDRFEDLIAVNALFRPGPLDGGDAYKYAELKQHKIPIEYWHNLVIPYLEKTYGIMAYQEQMQQIAQALGKFTPDQSDDMRKATSKLYRMGKQEAKDFMAQYHEQWMKGCDENGLPEEEAQDIWERMLAFGGYSFNRSHSASYSLAGYQDAWLKHHYPAEFYTPLLTTEEEREPVIREARAVSDIDIVPPNINTARTGFSITDEGLMYGLESVKYVGAKSAQTVIEHRPYSSFEDFRAKIPAKHCNSQAQRHLIAAGAFDLIGSRENMDIEDKREQEIESLGVALTGVGDSAKLYAPILEPRVCSESKFDRLSEGKSVVVGGELVSIKHHKIKSGFNKGETMGFAQVIYKDNTFDLTIFKNTYEQYLDLLKDGNIVMIRGKKGSREEVLVDTIIEVEELKKVIENETNN